MVPNPKETFIKIEKAMDDYEYAEKIVKFWGGKESESVIGRTATGPRPPAPKPPGKRDKYEAVKV